MVATAVFDSVLGYRGSKRDRIARPISEDEQRFQAMGRFSAWPQHFTYISKECDEQFSLRFPHCQPARGKSTKIGPQQSYRSDSAVTTGHGDLVEACRSVPTTRIDQQGRRCSKQQWNSSDTFLGLSYS